MASDQLPPIKPQPSCNGLEDTRSGAGTQLHLEVAFKADCDVAGLPASLLCHADSGCAYDFCAEYIQPIVAQLLISAQARGARRTRSAGPQAGRHPPRRPLSTHLAPAITSGTCAGRK